MVGKNTSLRIIFKLFFKKGADTSSAYMGLEVSREREDEKGDICNYTKSPNALNRVTIFGLKQ